MATRADVIVNRSVNCEYFASTRCLSCDKIVKSGIRICSVMHRWYHSHCFAKADQENIPISCACGTKCNGRLDATEMCRANRELKVIETLQKELKATREHALLLENMIKCLSEPPHKEHRQIQTYSATKKCEKSKRVSNEFTVPLRNRFQYLTIEGELNTDEFVSSDQVSRSESPGQNCKIHDTLVKSDCHNNINKVTQNNISAILLADSHGRGIAGVLRFQEDLNTTSVVKPGAGIQEVVKDCKFKGCVLQNTFVVLLAGSNDIYKNELKVANRVLRDTLCTLVDHKVIVAGIPHRHDLIETSCVNKEIQKANRTYRMICKSNSNAFFLPVDDLERKHFTTHGMHLNKWGKSALSQKINVLVKSIISASHKCDTIPLPAAKDTFKVSAFPSSPGAAVREHKTSSAEESVGKETAVVTVMTDEATQSRAGNKETARMATLDDTAVHHGASSERPRSRKQPARARHPPPRSEDFYWPQMKTPPP